jgi:hypothetical protein
MHSNFDAVGIQVGRVGLCLALFAKSGFTSPGRATNGGSREADRIEGQVRDDYFTISRLFERSPSAVHGQ